MLRVSRILKRSQVVFHGTPHDFEEFKLDKMGTGEGAQAYGWGMYFTGSHEVARFYRDSLSSGNKEKGLIYEVQIPDVNFLLWDEPLKSQPHSVQEAIQAGIGDQVEIKRSRIEYGKIDLYVAGEWMGYCPDGSLEEMSGELLYRLLGRVVGGGDRAASLALHQRGVVGIKYLDGMSRSQGLGTYNYVIFSDHDVKVVKKNSIEVS